MSRRISNAGLHSLLAQRKRALNLPVELPYGVGDIACYCNCHRNTIMLIATGRKRCPYIRSAMARFFDMPEPALIARMFPQGDPFAIQSRSRGPKR